MSEQRIDTAADAATSRAADPGEGMGVTGAEAHTDPLNPGGSAGGDARMPQPGPDRPGDDGDVSAVTEGAAHLRDTEAKQSGSPDLSGREPAASGSATSGSAGSGSGPSGSAGSGSAGSRTTASGAAGAGSSGPSSAGREGTPPAETGEVSAAPSEDRRAERPGSVATEFGDRADEAPEDEIARPSI
jgi:hypothetical protein